MSPTIGIVERMRWMSALAASAVVAVGVIIALSMVGKPLTAPAATASGSDAAGSSATLDPLFKAQLYSGRKQNCLGERVEISGAIVEECHSHRSASTRASMHSSSISHGPTLIRRASPIPGRALNGRTAMPRSRMSFEVRPASGNLARSDPDLHRRHRSDPVRRRLLSGRVAGRWMDRLA